MNPIVRLYDSSGNLAAEIDPPRSVHALSSLGALPAACRVELLPEDARIPVSHHDRMIVELAGETLFDGPVVELRTDTLGRLRGLRGALAPELAWNERLSGPFADTTVGAVLVQLIDNLSYSPVHYAPEHDFDTPIDALFLDQYPLFYALDLLAKLAGNALWDLGWDGALRFRPADTPPDHVIYYDPRSHALKVWQSDEPIRNSFTGRGGIVGGNEFVRVFADPDSMAHYGPQPITLYFRPIHTEQVYQRLRDAILAEATQPALDKYLDIAGGGYAIRPGDRLELRGSPLPVPGDDRVFRVKTREVAWTAEKATTRLWFAQGRENAESYLRYLDHEHTGLDGDYVRRRVGPFELDFSALDSSAHVE